jgi:hypothetical protein
MKTPQQLAKENTIRIMDSLKLNDVHKEIVFLSMSGMTQKEIGDKLFSRLNGSSVNNKMKELFLLLNADRQKGEEQISNISGVYKKLAIFNF